MPDLGVVPEAAGVGVNLRAAASAEVSKVVYVLLTGGEDYQVRIVDSVVVETPGDGRDFPYVFHTEITEGWVLAYGIKETTTQAGVNYADYEADTATSVATLVTSRKIKNAASSLTATSGKSFES